MAPPWSTGLRCTCPPGRGYMHTRAPASAPRLFAGRQLVRTDGGAGALVPAVRSVPWRQVPGRRPPDRHCKQAQQGATASAPSFSAYWRAAESGRVGGGSTRWDARQSVRWAGGWRSCWRRRLTEHSSSSSSSTAGEPPERSRRRCVLQASCAATSTGQGCLQALRCVMYVCTCMYLAPVPPPAVPATPLRGPGRHPVGANPGPPCDYHVPR